MPETSSGPVVSESHNRRSAYQGWVAARKSGERVRLSPGAVPVAVGDELILIVGQRQFQAERSRNETVDRLVAESGKDRS